MNKPKALMTQYAEGCLISRELQDMMTEYAASARFDREMHDDIDLWADRQHAERMIQQVETEENETDIPETTE